MTWYYAGLQLTPGKTPESYTVISFEIRLSELQCYALGREQRFILHDKINERLKKIVTMFKCLAKLSRLNTDKASSAYFGCIRVEVRVENLYQDFTRDLIALRNKIKQDVVEISGVSFSRNSAKKRKKN
jgi:hypothetical protein